MDDNGRTLIDPATGIGGMELRYDAEGDILHFEDQISIGAYKIGISNLNARKIIEKWIPYLSKRRSVSFISDLPIDINIYQPPMTFTKRVFACYNAEGDYLKLGLEGSKADTGCQIGDFLSLAFNKAREFVSISFMDASGFLTHLMPL